jgi:uncharacterized protein (DUF486 family)
MDRLGSQRWIRAVIILGVAYALDGIAFGLLAGWSASNQMRIAWRLSAWLTSAAAFAAHIWYEHARLRNSPRTTALHVSSAAALGAFLLAVAANLHAHFTGSGNYSLLASALLLWPLVTWVPAFLVAYATAAMLARWSRKV